MSVRTTVARSGLRQALPLAAILTLNMGMSAIADAVATSGFVVRIGPHQLVWLWMATLLAALVTSGAVGVFIDRAPRGRLVTVLVVASAAAYAALGVLFLLHVAVRAALVLLFILADQQFFLFPVVFWTFANDFYRTAEGKRVFPWIQSGATLGQLLGNVVVGGLAATLAHVRLSPLFMLIAATCGLAAWGVLLRVPRRGGPAPRGQAADAAASGFKVVADYVRNVPVLRGIALTAFSAELAVLLLQYRFLAVLARAGSVTRVEALFALFTGATVALTAALQWLTAGRWLERVGLKRSFGALPGAAGLGAVLALFVPGLGGAGSAQVLTQVVKWGWDAPARAAFQGLLPDERRGRIATFLDSYVATFGSFGACTVLAALLLAAGGSGAAWLAPAYLGAAGLAGGAGMWFSQRVAAVYDQSMLNWRMGSRRRSRVLQALDLDL